MIITMSSTYSNMRNTPHTIVMTYSSDWCTEVHKLANGNICCCITGDEKRHVRLATGGIASVSWWNQIRWNYLSSPSGLRRERPNSSVLQYPDDAAMARGFLWLACHLRVHFNNSWHICLAFWIWSIYMLWLVFSDVFYCTNGYRWFTRLDLSFSTTCIRDHRLWSVQASVFHSGECRLPIVA